MMLTRTAPLPGLTFWHLLSTSDLHAFSRSGSNFMLLL